MSELDSRIKWKATGVHGHTWETLDGYLYTSDIPPVEAEEYDRVFQRAQELEAKLDAVPVDAIRAIYDSVPVLISSCRSSSRSASASLCASRTSH
jgi:hypothetical protein